MTASATMVAVLELISWWMGELDGELEDWGVMGEQSRILFILGAARKVRRWLVKGRTGRSESFPSQPRLPFRDQLPHEKLFMPETQGLNIYKHHVI
jgi:hypothetical protein